jgi:tetratricopeptide (TPR) repeat protein
MHLELGLVYLDMNNLDEAEIEFQNARRRDRKMAMAYYKLGQVYAKRMDRDNALKMYREGRKYDPKNAEVAYELAHIFLDTGDIDYAILSMERGLSVDAVDDSLAIELMGYVEKGTAEAVNFMDRLANFEYSDNFQLHYFLGKLYLKMDNEELALKHFKLASELSESNADVFYQLGRLQEKQEPEKAEEQYQKAAEISASGETEAVMDKAAEADLLFKAAQGYLADGFEDKFIETAQQALALNPKRADIHIQLAGIFKKRADIYKTTGKKEQEDAMLEEAVKHYEQATALKPDAESWYELGLLYERQEKIKAVRAYDKAIQLKPDFARAYYRRGDFRLHFKVGRLSVRMYQPEVAVEDLKKAIELDDKLADAHFSLGLAYHEMDQPELATAQYAKTVEINPDHLKANIYLAQDYEAAGEYQKAIKYYSKAAELDDNNAEVLRALGSLQLRYGGDAGVKPAREALEKAVKLRPDDAEILMNYGYTLYLGMKFESAIDYYKKSLEIDPNYLEANYNIALAYNRVNKYDLARQHWEKVIDIWPGSRLAIKSEEFLEKLKKSQ